jgi:hypothetical protein
MKKILPVLALVTTTANANLIEKILNHKSNVINIDGMQMEMVESKIVPGSFYYKMASKKPSHGTISDQTIESLRKDLIAAGYNNVKITHTTGVVDLTNQDTGSSFTEAERETARIAVAQQQAEIEARNKRTPEQAVKESRDMVYGDGGVMQDPHVLEAWRAADEAQKRLQEHREYMRRVRESKTLIEQSKKTEAGLENKLAETS